MTTITIIPTLYTAPSQLIKGEEYRRVTAIDMKNRYIDMRNWGINYEIGWVETDPLTLDEILPTEIVDEWSNRWENDLGLSAITIGKPFIYTPKIEVSYSNHEAHMMLVDLVKLNTPLVERTIRYKPLELKDGILVPSYIIPDQMLRQFDFVKGLPIVSGLDGLFRLYLHQMELCDINVENLIDSDGFVTFTAGFEGNRSPGCKPN